MTHFDASARVSVDISAFSRAAQRATRDTTNWDAATRRLQTSLTGLETRVRRTSTSLNASLRIYQRINTALRGYNTNLERLSATTSRASNASRGLRTTLTGLATATSAVRTATTQENTRLTRTVTLYERLARAAQSYASSLITLRAAINSSTASQARLNSVLSLTAALSNQVRNNTRGMATGMTQTGNATRTTSTAMQQLNRATGQATLANINMSTSLFSLRSALTDYQSAIQRVRDLLLAIPAASFQAAISQEAAFAHIARVTQDTTVDLQAMRSQLQGMSTDVPIAFEQLARIGVLGAQIGIARENLVVFTDTVARFAATTAVSEEQTALLAGRIAQLAQVPETEFVNLLSGISELGSNSAATEEAILRMTEQISTSTRAAGIGTEAMIGLAGAIASLGLRPELARGALQRVFAILRDNIDDAGDSLERMAQLMNLTAQEVVNLQRTDPEQFFLAFIEGTGRAQENGEALRRTLKDIGIGNTRDIELISRLGLNYDFLARQIDLANDSYAEGTFLQRESEKIFGTTRAAIDRLTNAWQNFQANAVDPMLRILAPALSAIASGLNAISQSPVATFLAGLAISVAVAAGAWIAYRAALAGIATGLIAMRQIQGQLQSQTLSLRTVWELYRETQVRSTVATTANTTAMRAQGATAAFTAANVNAAGLALGGMTTRAAGAAVATRGLTAAAGPLGLALTGISVLMTGALLVGLSQTRDRLSESARAAIDAAGGMSAFRNAVREDTEALREGVGAHRTYTSSRDQMTDATRRSLQATIDENRARINQIELLHGSTVQLRETAKGTGTAADQAREYVEQIDRMGRSILDAKSALEGTTAAFGEQAAAIQASALETALLESELAKSESAMQFFRETGLDLGEILKQSFTDPQGAIKALNDELDTQIRLLASIEGVDLSDSLATLPVNEATENLDALGKTIQDLVGIINEYDDELAATSRTHELLGSDMISLSRDAMAAGGGLNEMEESAEDLGDALGAVSDIAKGFADTLQGLGTPLTAWQTAVEKANESARKAWEASHDSMDGFAEASRVGLGAYRKELENVVAAQREWATNMVALAARVPPDVAHQLARLGPEAAPLIAELVDASDKELSELIPLFRATSEAASIQLAEGLEFAIPAMHGIGGRAGDALAQTLSNELRTAASEGGNFHGAITRFMELLALVDETEVNPFISLNDVEAKKTLDEFEADLRRREREARLDPKGFAQLNPELYEYEMSQLEGRANTSTRDNTIGPTGVPELDGTGWESELNSLENRTDTATNQNEIGPEGAAGLRSARYIEELARISDRAKRTGLTINKALSVNPRLNLTRVYNQLSALQSRAYQVGANVQAALTRQASITVTTHVRSGSSTHGQQALASGGWVTGKGGPRQDNIPAWLSAGEFVVNARAAARYGALLEQLNSFNGGGGAPFDQGLVSRPFAQSATSGPSRPAVATPERIRMSAQEPTIQPRMVINVHNTYPRSEPTSVTVNRSLAYAAALDGV